MKRIGKTTIFVLLALALVAGAVLVLASGTSYDLISNTSVTVNGDAIFQYFDTDFADGTGNLEPFVRVQASPDEAGYNSDLGNTALEFDTKGGLWTHSILLSEIPSIDIGGINYLEFIGDFNEANSGVDAQISIDAFEIYLFDDSEVAFDPARMGDPANNGIDTTYPYGRDGFRHPDPITPAAPWGTPDWYLDGHVLATEENSSGSGQGDVRILVPESELSGHPECFYGSTTCDTYLVNFVAFGFYSELYESGGEEPPDGIDPAEWTTTSTFEEIAVRDYAVIDLSKTLDVTYQEEIAWTLEKTVNPDSHTGKAGEAAGMSTWKVQATKSVTNVNYRADGKIVFSNNSGEDLYVSEVVDTFNGYAVTLTCPDLPFLVANGDEVSCTYTADLGDDPSMPDGGWENFVEIGYYQLINDVEGPTLNRFAVASDDTPASRGTIGDESVTVDDDRDTESQFPATISSSTTFDYNETFTCSDDQADYTNGEDVDEYPNTATLTGDNTDLSDDASVTVTCTLDALQPSKTASTSFTRTHDWSIDKSVDQDAPFVGETVNYKIAVSYDGPTDSNWAVAGTISVYNPASIAQTFSVSDQLNDLTVANVDCNPDEEGNQAGGTVEADVTVTCTYTASPADDSATLNTATVTAAGNLAQTAEADVLFGDPTTEIDKTVTASDLGLDLSQEFTAPTGGSFNGSTSYDSTGAKNNTACVAEASEDDYGDPDENCDTVTVTVYDISVSKTASTSFTRTHDWSIDKSVDQAAPFVGEQVQYTIDVSYDGPTDSDWAVAGTITVFNNHPTRTASVVLNDPLAGITNQALDAAPGSTNVNYSADLLSGADTVNTATATLFSKDYSGQADVLFGDPTTEIDKTVTASDLGLDLSQEFTAPTGGSFSGFTSYASTGAKDNTACVAETSEDDDGDPGENCDTVTVNVYDISVSKTASTSFTRTHDWSIAKSVDQAAPFVGEQVQYTINVSYDGPTDSGWAVAGTITVLNNHPTRTASVVLNDPLAGITNQALNAAPGNNLVNYSAGLGSGADTVNIATATLFNKDYSGQADVQFGSATITEIDKTVTASDLGLGLSKEFTAPTGGSFNGSTSYASTGAKNNTACVAEASEDDYGDPDENCDTVTVNVYDVTVTKTASSSFTRNWDWQITKTVMWDDPDDETNDLVPVPDPFNLTENGAGVTVVYEVTASTIGYTDSAHLVSGGFTITNNHPTRSIDVSYVDKLSDGTPVAAGSATVDAGQPFTSNYSATPGAIADGTNGILITTQFGQTDDASAGYSFTPGADGLTITVEDGQAVVADTNGAFGGPFTITADLVDGAEESWTYSVDLVHTGVCTDVQYENTASVSVIGGIEYHEASVTVNVYEECFEVLTRTPGYWKTHSGAHQGGARIDETWYLLGDLAWDEQFLDTDLTWYEVLSQPDGGNPWNTLARHYAAAYLNTLAGTDPTDLEDIWIDFDGSGTADPGETVNVMDKALDLLTNFDGVINNMGIDDYSPDGNPWTRKELRDMGFKGRVVSQYLNSFAELYYVAEYLDEYNNGIVGPGHAHG